MLSFITSLATLQTATAAAINTPYSNDTTLSTPTESLNATVALASTTIQNHIFAPAERTFATVYIRITQASPNNTLSNNTATSTAGVTASASTTKTTSTPISTASETSKGSTNAAGVPKMNLLVPGALMAVSAALFL